MTHKPWFDKFKPISWEGWAVYISLVAITIFDFRMIDATSNSKSETLIAFFGQFAIIFLIFSLIVRARRNGQNS